MLLEEGCNGEMYQSFRFGHGLGFLGDRASE
jgi:hypothetical protein